MIVHCISIDDEITRNLVLHKLLVAYYVACDSILIIRSYTIMQCAQSCVHRNHEILSISKWFRNTRNQTVSKFQPSFDLCFVLVAQP